MLRSKVIYSIMTVLTLGAYAWVGLHVMRPEATGSWCLFKGVTGIACPSCGITRAVILMLDGQWLAGTLLNPLAIPAVVAMATIPLWLLYDALTKRRSFAHAYLWTENRIKKNKTIWIPLTVIVLVNWGWNIIKDL